MFIQHPWVLIFMISILTQVSSFCFKLMKVYSWFKCLCWECVILWKCEDILILHVPLRVSFSVYHLTSLAHLLFIIIALCYCNRYFIFKNSKSFFLCHALQVLLQCDILVCSILAPGALLPDLLCMEISLCFNPVGGDKSDFISHGLPNPHFTSNATTLSLVTWLGCWEIVVIFQ